MFVERVTFNETRKLVWSLVEAGINIVRISDVAGVTATTVYAWKNGSNRMPKDIYNRLTNVLNGELSGTTPEKKTGVKPATARKIVARKTGRGQVRKSPFMSKTKTKRFVNSICDEYGATAADIAKATGRSTSAVYNWVSGKNGMRHSDAGKIKDAIKRTKQDMPDYSNTTIEPPTYPPKKFIEHECYEDLNNTIQAKDLYDKYHAWCIDNDHIPETATGFGIKTREAGYVPSKSCGVMRYKGIGIDGVRPHLISEQRQKSDWVVTVKNGSFTMEATTTKTTAAHILAQMASDMEASCTTK